METSPDPAGVAKVGAADAPFDLRKVPSAPKASSITSPEPSEYHTFQFPLFVKSVRASGVAGMLLVSATVPEASGKV